MYSLGLFTRAVCMEFEQGDLNTLYGISVFFLPGFLPRIPEFDWENAFLILNG